MTVFTIPDTFFHPNSKIFDIIHITMKTLMSIFAAAAASVALSAEVSSVRVLAVDGFGGDAGSVASRCQTRAGATYDPVVVTRDVNALKASGEFEDISAVANEGAGGIEVVFKVRRKFRYAPPLVVRGCKFFGESKIAKESELKDGFLYGEAELAAAAAKVRLAYQKKYFTDAKVVPKVDILSGNNATVTFVIDEGVRRKVSGIVFDGAEHAVESSVISRNANPFYSLGPGEFDEIELRDAIDDYPWWNPVGWFADAPVTLDQRAQCCDKIAEVYRNHGYLDVTVSGPETVDSGSGANLIFKIEEGPQYKVGAISIVGLTKYSEADIKAKSDLPAEGSVAGRKALDEAADRVKISVGSGDAGLADTRVTVKYVPSETDPSSVDVVFQVAEGVPVVLNDVKIRGNDYTKDNVIRREIALGPGDRMLEDRADRSKKRLENLDYFSRVRYYLEPCDRGKDPNGSEYRNLVYEVEEKNTGSFMVGVGASSVDSVYLTAEVNQNNFDLFAPSRLFRGAGQKGRAYVAWGPRYQSLELGFVEPYFLTRMLELSVDVYRRLRWYDQYDLVRSGADASISYPVKFWPTWNPFGRVGIGLSGEYIEFDDVEWGTRYLDHWKEVSFVEEERRYGDATEPVLHFFWSRDTRDNFKIPTQGYRSRVFFDLAPAGDNEYWRLGLQHRSYFNVWKRYGHVLMAGLRAETIDAISDDVPIYNRMFLGGPKSIRGIKYRNVAPMTSRHPLMDIDTAPWGGQTLVCANFEYTIPIVKMFRLAFFSDLGSVGVDAFDADFGGTFAWTVGVGLRLDIPMFPIRLDLGTPIKKPSGAEEEVFSFTVGYDF